MSTILVVDDMAIFRDPIAASLRLAGYETVTASDGEEAMRLALLHRPDLVLLDVAMPKMDGITFLKRLRADPLVSRIPVLLLTAISDRDRIVSAGVLGVQGYLLKSRFHLKDLLERIAKLLALPAVATATEPSQAINEATSVGKTDSLPAGSGAEASTTTSAAPAAAVPVNTKGDVPRLMTREQCVARAEGVLQTKTLSGVITQVMSVANSPRGDNAQLATLIGRDPMMSARVLQAANSAAYASNGGIVTNISDAIRKVGCSAVRNIAAALGIFEVMPETTADGFNPIRCWQHSFAVAQLCEQLAAARPAEEAGIAYVVGLCHDLAEILIRGHFGAEYQKVADATERSGLPRDHVQREMLGMTHVELVRVIFKCIGLPDSIREPVELVHGPARDRSNRPLVQILWMAENYANGAMLASAPTSTVAPLANAMCQSAIGSAGLPHLDPATLRAEVMCLTATLAGLSKREEAQLMAPLFKPSTARLWLARDPGLSSFDPIETALRLLAEVTVQPRLPDATQANLVDGVVIASRHGEVAGFTQADAKAFEASCVRAGRGIIPMLRVQSDAACLPRGAGETSPLDLAQIAAFAEKAASAALPAAA